MEIGDCPDEYWALPEHAEEVRARPKAPPVVFVPFRDPYLDARADVRALVKPEHAGVEVRSWGAGSKTLDAAKALHHRVILLDGAIGGLWDYDADAGRVEWATFDTVKGKTRRAIEDCSTELASFLEESFGHARVYPMESAKSHASRLDAIRALKE